MVYILEQRLTAQNISSHKAAKVLGDVIRTMYYPRFIEELFKPQEVYSIQSTRQIFDKLAHSSIMRLNESSMEKLFDLMAMGFKHQLVSALSPMETVDFTLNHLESLKAIIANETQADVQAMLDDCVKQVRRSYGAMSMSELNSLRQSLCTFFQDRKTKVSLFLSDGVQKTDGSFVASVAGSMTPVPPGTIRYFNAGQVVRREALPVVNASQWGAKKGVRSTLGCNVYTKNATIPAPAPATPAPAPVPVVEEPAPVQPAVDQAKRAAAVGELNLLASLIGAPPPAADTFKLESLFCSDIFAKDGSSKGVDTIEIDGTAPSQHRHSLETIRQQMEAADGATAGGADDLLDLMDQA